MDKLIESKLAAIKKGVFQDELLHKFKCFHSEDSLDMVDCKFDVVKCSNVVFTITRNWFHHGKYILFMEFFYINDEEIFAAKEDYEEMILVKE